VDERNAHSIFLRGRKQLVMEGVHHVDSFDESEIILQTNMGVVLLKGEGLHITQLNLETGNLTAEGFFVSLQYKESKGKGKGAGKKILNRLFK